jgi:hypothetical protein
MQKIQKNQKNKDFSAIFLKMMKKLQGLKKV